MTIYQLYLKGRLHPVATRKTVLEYCEINKAFKHERAHGASYREALLLVSEGMHVSPDTVRRAVRLVNK